MFVLVFGLRTPVPVHGMMDYAADFLPQLFMIALMGSLIPGLLTMHRHGVPASVRLFRFAGGAAVVTRSLLVAVGTAVIVGGALALLFHLFAPSHLPTVPALAIKVAIGALVAAVVTPAAVRHALTGSTTGGAC